MVDSSISKLLNSKKSKKQVEKSPNSKKYKEFLDKKRKYSKKKNPINSILINNKIKNKSNIKKKISWSINKPSFKENKNSKPNISFTIKDDFNEDKSNEDKSNEDKSNEDKSVEDKKEKSIKKVSIGAPKTESLKKVNIEQNVKDPVFKFDRSESKIIKNKTNKKSKKKKEKKNRKVSFFVKKSKKKDKETMKKLADNVNNKNTDDMIKELKEKGITISGKSNNLLKDIYFCVMNDNININKE